MYLPNGPKGSERIPPSNTRAPRTQERQRLRQEQDEDYFYHEINNATTFIGFYPQIIWFVILLEPSERIKLILLKLRILSFHILK